jgi:hypothetical protein
MASSTASETPVRLPPFQADVVVGAHPGEHRDLLPAQALDPPLATEERDAGLLRGEPLAAGGEEVADLVPVVHVFDGTTPPGPGGRVWRYRASRSLPHVPGIRFR